MALFGLAGLVPVLVVAVLGLGWVASGRAIAPATLSSPWALADFPRLRPARVSLTAADGVTLEGRLFPGTGAGAVVLTHGYGGTQDEMLPLADELVGAGFTVLTYDSRGCGSSGGQVTFGSRETGDVSTAVSALAATPGVDPKRIGAVGFSMGAASTLMAAARDDRIRAVVADSAWADVYSWLRPDAREVVTAPLAPFTPLSLALAQLRTGARLDALRPVDEVGRIAPRPLLLIHGDQDQVVPPSDGVRLFHAAGEPRQLWLVPGAGHGDTIALREPGYARWVISFLTGALRH